MNNVSFGGLATGLDTGAIVSQLLEIRRQPIYRFEAQKETWTKQKTALTDLKTKLEALQTAALNLNTQQSFAALGATSSHESLLTASASGSAAPGNYSIEVLSLASTQKDISQGYASLADTVGSGSISVTVNGETTDIDLAGPTSLSGVVDAINDAGAGVYASILNDGSDGTPYRLILSSAESGVANGFTLDMSGLSGGTSPIMTNQTAAADASLTIDDIAVTSPTNSISSAISGLTFDLLNAEVGTSIEVSVTTDATLVSENVQALVDAYNDLMTYVDAKSAKDQILHGHSATRTIKSQIQSLMSYPLTTGSGDLRLLSQIGLDVQLGGQINFSQTEFAEALGDDYAAVRDLFIERSGNVGKASLLDTAIDSLTNSVDGIFKISNRALDAKISNADDSILRYQRSVDSYEIYLNRKFSAMEMAVSALQSQGSYLATQFG